MGSSQSSQEHEQEPTYPPSTVGWNSSAAAAGSTAISPTHTLLNPSVFMGEESGSSSTIYQEMAEKVDELVTKNEEMSNSLITMARRLDEQSQLIFMLLIVIAVLTLFTAARLIGKVLHYCCIQKRVVGGGGESEGKNNSVNYGWSRYKADNGGGSEEAAIEMGGGNGAMLTALPQQQHRNGEFHRELEARLSDPHHNNHNNAVVFQQQQPHKK